jgi:hypothetical protein
MGGPRSGTRTLIGWGLYSSLVVWASLAGPATAAKPNYDESKVPAYQLPDPLVLSDGTKVTDKETWRTKRRPEVMRLFAQHVYGVTPTKKVAMRVETFDDTADVIGGLARRKQFAMRFGDGNDGPLVDMLLYLPASAKGPVPVFLTLNFYGNHTIHPDPGIRLNTRSWMRSNTEFGVVKNRATEKSRGVRISRWPVEKILARGYGIAAIYYGDIDPDFHDEFKNGVHPLLDDYKEGRPAEAWGSIGAWAWGLSRAMDVLEGEDAINPKQVIVMGHSRLGKTALWAGAQDERFAITISNDSGCGGAALSQRAFGETIGIITSAFPHWFCGRLRDYAGKEGTMPVDQHQLIALCAPRPVYVASSAADFWADPRGEFLACVGASPVYKLFGLEGLPVSEMPAVGKAVHGTIGYHVKAGKHDLTEFDWQRYMNFADKQLAGK